MSQYHIVLNHSALPLAAEAGDGALTTKRLLSSSDGASSASSSTSSGYESHPGSKASAGLNSGVSESPFVHKINAALRKRSRAKSMTSYEVCQPGPLWVKTR